MDDECTSSSLTRRDIVGAWVLCAMMAALALGLAGNLHRGVPAADALATEISPPIAVSSSGSRSPIASARQGMRTVAGRRHLGPGQDRVRTSSIGPI